MTCEYPENAASRAYRYGCRCDRCTTYRREASAKYRATPEGRERNSKDHAKWRAKPENKKSIAQNGVKPQKGPLIKEQRKQNAEQQSLIKPPTMRIWT